MTEHLVDASLTEWEDGIDLVLDTRVSLLPTQVWPHVTRSELLEDWFVGYTTSDGPEDILLKLDDQPVPAQVLSVSAPQADDDEGHVLLDIDGIGRLGLTLRPLADDSVEWNDPAAAAGTSDASGVDGAADPAGAAGATDPADTASARIVGTRLTLSHTIADRGMDHAILAQVITQVGPVWETHLRLLAGKLTQSPGAYDVPESQLTLRYERLVEEIG